jgi:hypothetical protein
MAQSLHKFTKGVALKGRDADILEKFEVENDQRSWTRHIQKGLLGVVGMVLLITILASNISMIGT